MGFFPTAYHPTLHIRPSQPADLPEWRRMRTALWPDQTEADMAAWLARPDAITLVAECVPEHARDDTGPRLCAFAEASTRPFADGCESSPVAYLEGWYVDPDHRRRAIGTALIRAVEDWARARGLTELASDAELHNTTSHRAHASLGFTEVARAILYAKRL